jgi:pimeloyl-ACP methyl ester carboxylesterase
VARRLRVVHNDPGKNGEDAMRRGLLAFMLAFATMPAHADDDIVLRGMGSFHIGGHIAEVSGKPVKDIQRVPGGPISKLDPNGQFMVEQMYVQFFLPKSRKGKYPLLMWHGGGLTGVTYESTPDGREGWMTMFIRKGWDTYVSDAVERGRSGFASPDVWQNDAPIFLNYQDPFERFRIGAGAGSFNPDPAKRKLLPGSQFPAEAYDNYMRQSVPRWLGTDKAVVAAYAALVEKVCPCVLLVHSQSGQFALRVAEAHPEKIKAIVAIEPAGSGSADKAAALKGVPVLALFGDYVDEHPRWTAYRKQIVAYGDALKAAGGSFELTMLPDLGIKGNSHMMMQDRNNAQIADVIQKWFVARGLVD